MFNRFVVQFRFKLLVLCYLPDSLPKILIGGILPLSPDNNNLSTQIMREKLTDLIANKQASCQYNHAW